jgi:hypothetical protein
MKYQNMMNLEENGIVCPVVWNNLMRKTLANGDSIALNSQS